MDDFLTKPVKADHLCETVERWVRASGPAPSAPERELAPVAP